jgi:hypothetical protein
VCNYCRQIDELRRMYGTGLEDGNEKFNDIVKRIKHYGKGKKYDCVVGVSGGVDSSYLLYLAKKYGLRPLAVHYDNTWNSAIATMNIQKVLHKLKIDLYTHVVNNKELDDILRSFFFAGVPELDAHTDLAYAYVLRKVCSRYGIKYILEGHSFIEEGITPIQDNYFDGKYIKSIHKKFGKVSLKTYPLMTFSKFLKSIILDRVEFIRPFWYINYSKTSSREFLSKFCDWKNYGGHHLENRITSYALSVYLPEKFNIDRRYYTISADLRNGLISRSDAIEKYNSPPVIEENIISYFKKRLNLSDKIYEEVMESSPKKWSDYQTYKKRFEIMRPIFKVLAKSNHVPMSFYLKYCFPIKINE